MVLSSYVLFLLLLRFACTVVRFKQCVALAVLHSCMLPHCCCVLLVALFDLKNRGRGPIVLVSLH